MFHMNNGKENLGKFDANGDGVFLGYATKNHAYRVYNKRLMIVEESVHVVFDEFNSKLQDEVIIDATDNDAIVEKEDQTKNESIEKEI